MRILTLALAIALLAGCDNQADDDTAGDDDTVGDDDSAAEPGLAPCTLADAPVASFEVAQYAFADSWTIAVTGNVWEEPFPSWHEVLLQTENCRYMIYLPVTCNPPCDFDEICTSGGECVGWPAGVAAGNLTVEGLGDPPVLDPEEYAPGSYYESLSIPLDQFGEWSPVSLSLTGDTFPALDLSARGVADVVADVEADGLSIPDAQPVTVTWNASSDPNACAQVNLYTQNMGHGLPIMNVMECVGPDTGSLTIPAEMTDIWPDWATPEACAGIDCPYSEVVRYTRQIVETEAGDAWLTVWARSQFRLLGE